MRDSKPSSSAQTVALARAHLHWAAIVDDPWAERMLMPRRRVAARALRRWPLSRYGQSATFSFLAARTRFFDDAVTDAIEGGLRQIAIIGAGYDTRAWRLARPSVRFFELDHPATQQDKQQRAPAGDVVYVPVNLPDDPLEDLLLAAGFAIADPSVFIVEGLTMYLPEAATEEVFAALAAAGAPGSRLAVNFTASGGGSVSPISRLLATAIRTTWSLSGEPTYHWATRANVPPLLARTGWTQTECLTGPAVALRYLSDTAMATSGVNPEAFCVSAHRAAVELSTDDDA
jgi:methyltransferase (TIGR00027 family)